jgi:hypothetical protein
MPKLVQELNNFNVGTLTTPDVRDIPSEAASYSLDLDSVVEDGLLRGVPADAVQTTDTSASTTTMDAYITATIQRNASTRDVVYYKNSNNTVSMIQDFEGTPETITTYDNSASGVVVSGGDEVCMVTNNREVHIGTGSASTDVPKWLGWVDYGQFGANAPTDPVFSDAELKSFEAFPQLYKVIYYDSYFYGIMYQGTNVYKIHSTTGAVTQSVKDFGSTQGLALAGDNALWVYDGTQGSEGTLFKVSNSDMSVTQTNGLVSSLTNIITDGKLTDIREVGSNIFFSAWRETSFAAGNVTSGARCWLYRVAEPTTSGNITLTETTPTWLCVNSTASGDAGKWTDGAGSGTPTITLKFFQAPLVEITSSTEYVGCIVRETHTGAAASNRYLVSTNSAGGGSGRSGNAGKAEGGSSAQDIHSMDNFVVLAGGSSTNDSLYFSGSTGYFVHNLLDDGTDNAEGWASNTVDSIYNDGNRVHVVDHDSDDTSNLQSWDDIEAITDYKAIVRTGSKHNIGDVNRAATIVVGTGSISQTIYLFNGTDGGRFLKYTYTYSTNAISTKTVVARSPISLTATSTANTNGAFESTKRYFYCVSAVYDGYQESVLSTPTPVTLDTAADNYTIEVQMDLRDLTSISKRVSHLNLYRGETVDLTSFKADGFFRLVSSFRLNAEWGAVTDEVWEEDSSDTFRQMKYDDNASLGASYDAINGISEVLDKTIVHYALSTQLNGHHVVAKCYHPDLPDADRYIIKSKPGKFDQFNWTTDFVRLPSIPVAMTAFQGRIYAWDENTTYKINLDGMYIEDIYDGIGCIGHQAVKVTEYGMCFADENNIYLHDGRQAEAISEAIKDGDAVPRPTNLAGSSVTSLDVSWDGKASTAGANKAAICVDFDPKRNSFLVFWSHAASSDPSRAYCWAYNIPRKRWDLWSVTTGSTSAYVRTTFQDSKGNIYYSDATNCYKFQGAATRKRYEYMTKLLSMGQHTQPKKFHGWELRYKRSTTSEEAAKYPLIYWSVQNGTVWTHGTHSGDFAETSNVQNSNTVYTHMQGKLRASNGGAAQAQEARDIKFFVKDNIESNDTTIAATEVDSLGVVFRPSRKAARTVTF